MKFTRPKLRQHVSKQTLVPVETWERDTLGSSILMGVRAVEPSDLREVFEHHLCAPYDEGNRLAESARRLVAGPVWATGSFQNGELMLTLTDAV